MVSLAIFPCKFTDGARVLGELSYSLNKMVYTDQMLLTALADSLNVESEELQLTLFPETQRSAGGVYLREELIESLHQFLESLVLSDEDWIYYGFFSLLFQSEKSCMQKILIFADQECRVKRAVRQEKVTQEVARMLIQKHDQKAAEWTHYLFSCEPYAPELYNTVIHYNCQDLLDVVAYIFMLYENMQQLGIVQYQFGQGISLADRQIG